MSLLKVAGTAASSGTLYVDDVFSTWLYTGNGATQTITNGIDLAGKGGLVWIKTRTNSSNHKLTDTVRGATKGLISNDTAAQTTDANGLTSFGSTGFSIGTDSVYNGALTSYVSWTFREAAKFFDVVSLTNGTTTYSHSLGVAPGMIVVKCTSAAGANWVVYHRSLTDPTTYYLSLNTTDQQLQLGGATIWGVTDSTFTVSSSLWANGTTGIAYLFAHDTSSTGIIQCGSYTKSGLTEINLGWEPQFILTKKVNTTSNWFMMDNMRGLFSESYRANGLAANLNSSEFGSMSYYIRSNGFRDDHSADTNVVIYMAIRRPNKPPTTGTQVFGLNARTGTGANATVTGGQTDDAVLIKNRGSAVADLFSSRLTSTGYLVTSSTAAEVAAGTTILQANPWDVMDGVKVGTTSTITNASANTFINYFFKRAPGFFDEVCYTGTGSATTQAHNLGVVPELVIQKNRTAADAWETTCANFSNPNQQVVRLNTNGAILNVGVDYIYNRTATSVSFDASLANNGSNYVAYLFATLAGISKVGSYTGNGTGQVIACGFSAGARFVLIKRTDSTGDWYTFDSARGLTVGSSPYLLLNSTAVETTGINGVYASTGGFTLDATALLTTNIVGASYIFLAVS